MQKIILLRDKILLIVSGLIHTLFRRAKATPVLDVLSNVRRVGRTKPGVPTGTARSGGD
jgi:hypothetical protein